MITIAIGTGSTFPSGKLRSLTGSVGGTARDCGARVTRARMPDLQTAVSRSDHDQRRGKVRKRFAKPTGITFAARRNRLTLVRHSSGELAPVKVVCVSKPRRGQFQRSRIYHCCNYDDITVLENSGQQGNFCC